MACTSRAKSLLLVLILLAVCTTSLLIAFFLVIILVRIVLSLQWLETVVLLKRFQSAGLKFETILLEIFEQSL
jgi:hypothetical protein